MLPKEVQPLQCRWCSSSVDGVHVDGCRTLATVNDVPAPVPVDYTPFTTNSETRPELQEGIKYDGGKPRYDLIPGGPLEALAEVYAIGATKYADRNWELGMKYGRIFAALMRHLWAFWRGQDTDPETGLFHLAQAAWGCLALLEYRMRDTGEDDRGKGNKRTDRPVECPQSYPPIGSGRL